MQFLYISSGSGFAPDNHLLRGLSENGHAVQELTVSPARPFSLISHFRRLLFRGDAVIVGYGLPLFVPVARFLTTRPIVFNAIASQYEANVVSRGEGGFYAALKWRFIDLLSFHAASFVLLESHAQVAYMRRLLFMGPKKLVVARMGVDESVFFRDEKVAKQSRFTVLFRGRFLPESGILTVLEAAKLLEDIDIKFLIIGHGFLYRKVHALMNELNPKNVELIEKTLPERELREAMLSSHVSLGQLANHPRLMRTLPAKLYESLALGLPYLTGRSGAVFELLTEDETCFAVAPGDAEALAEKIRELQHDPVRLREVAEAGYRLFKEQLTSKRLAADFVATCFDR